MAVILSFFACLTLAMMWNSWEFDWKAVHGMLISFAFQDRNQKHTGCVAISLFSDSRSKVVVAIGSCPASCNVFAGSPVVVGPLDRFSTCGCICTWLPSSPGRNHLWNCPATEILAEKVAQNIVVKGRWHESWLNFTSCICFPGIIYRFLPRGLFYGLTAR